MKKIIGLAFLFIALGMLIMIFIFNRIIGLIIIALLIFAGINCLWCD